MKGLTKLATAVVAGLLLFGVAPATVTTTAAIFALAVVSLYGGDPASFAHEFIDRAEEVTAAARAVVTRVGDEVKTITGAK